MDTFYWHDYETWGTDPSIDRPSQFAGIRTDLDLNIIDKPMNIMCRPSLDCIPHAEACLITKILPQDAEKNGLKEKDFFLKIYNEMIKPNTCSLGFNSLRFDDEVTRYGLYRNFYDPYEREWKNNNSRWDIIDLVRLCYALRPDGINWPINTEGHVSFKLEDLTRKNNLTHDSAHDALSDVYATIAIAKLIKNTHPKLFNHVFNLRKKNNIKSILKIGSNTPLLNISSYYGKDNLNMSMILPIFENKKNKNEVICIDLRYPTKNLLDLSVQEICDGLYKKNNNEIKIKIPIMSIHLNRCPILLTTKLLTQELADRALINIDQFNLHLEKYKSSYGLKEKLENIIENREFIPRELDAEQRLYDGFIPYADQSLINKISSISSQELSKDISIQKKNREFIFEDDRLDDLLFRYRARNFEESLSSTEKKIWYEYCYNKYFKGSSSRLSEELKAVSELIVRYPESADFLKKITDYLNEKNIYIEKNVM